MVDVRSLFSRQAKGLLGIDISASAIKLVGLGGDAAAPVLEQCAMESLPEGCVVDGNIESPDEVAVAIRRIVKNSGAHCKNVALALPSSAVITKKLTVPAGLPELEMEDQVEIEAKQYIPFPLEEVSLDFYELGADPDALGNMEVLIAAARRERVQALQDLAQTAGVTPVVVDVGSYALRLALARVIEVQAKSTPGTLSVLFKLGASSTAMQVLRGSDLVFEREQSGGGMQLTKKISSHYGLSLAEAERKKCQGVLGHGYEAEILVPYLEETVQELGRALQFFFHSTQYNKVNQVFLAGGSALLPGLAAAVARQIQVPCSVVNPFEGMVVGPRIERERVLQEAPSYLGACGLAMRRFFN